MYTYICTYNVYYILIINLLLNTTSLTCNSSTYSFVRSLYFLLFSPCLPACLSPSPLYSSQSPPFRKTLLSRSQVNASARARVACLNNLWLFRKCICIVLYIYYRLLSLNILVAVRVDDGLLACLLACLLVLMNFNRKQQQHQQQK